MTKKKSSAGLGRALANAQKARKNDPLYRDAYKQVTEGLDAQKELAKKSCLEQTTLDDFLATAEMAQTDFHATRGKPQVIGERTVVKNENIVLDCRSEMSGMAVPIPRRPVWTSALTKEELLELENQAFLTWRKQLATIEEDLNCTMTPFERNLDFWRQLWRVVEKSNLIVYLVDARDPLFYRCIDLENYVKEVSPDKRVIILLNKVDFLTKELREEWIEYFKVRNVELVCFSALKELEKLGDFVNPERRNLDDDDEDEDEEEKNPVGVLGDHYDGSEILDTNGLIAHLTDICPASPETGHQTIGFVGYPNVGKSTLINALFGKKKASMSRQPGKTRHFQTLELTENVTLCDCPGLVFPKVVATKAHLVINNTMSVDALRNFHSPCQLIAEKIGVLELYKRYGVPLTMREKIKKVGDFLQDFAKYRRHFLRLGVPDEKWSCRRVLNDFVVGRLLHCETPNGSLVRTIEAEREEMLREAAEMKRKEREEKGLGSDDEDEDDLNDDFASDFELEDGEPIIKDADKFGEKNLTKVAKNSKQTKRARRLEQKQIAIQRQFASPVFTTF